MDLHWWRTTEAPCGFARQIRPMLHFYLQCRSLHWSAGRWEVAQFLLSLKKLRSRTSLVVKDWPQSVSTAANCVSLLKAASTAARNKRLLQGSLRIIRRFFRSGKTKIGMSTSSRWSVNRTSCLSTTQNRFSPASPCAVSILGTQFRLRTMRTDFHDQVIWSASLPNGFRTNFGDSLERARTESAAVSNPSN